jgi:intracellular septation protein A
MTVWWGIFFLLYALALALVAQSLPLAWFACALSGLTGAYILAELVNRRKT